MNRLDQIRGMYAGHHIGDALGSPHEFRSKLKYTGKLEHEVPHFSRWQGTSYSPIGSVSDDTEMSLALTRQLIEDNGEYVRNNIILAYLEWGNSNCISMGRNTRNMLKGVKTLRGYKGRLEKYEQNSGNGCLMRCFPLSLIDMDTCEDTSITNDNEECLEACDVYVYALKLALRGKSKNSILRRSKKYATELKYIFDLDKRDLKVNKGYVLNALWCAFYVLKNFDSYTEAMKWIITQKGSDTDTNAAISGALLGAWLGFEKLMEEQQENFDILISVESNRPDKYKPNDFFEYTEQMSSFSE